MRRLITLFLVVLLLGAMAAPVAERYAAIEDGRAACDGLVRFDGETRDHCTSSMSPM